MAPMIPSTLAFDWNLVGELDFAVTGRGDVPLDHRQKLAVGRDEVAAAQRAEDQGDHDAAADPIGRPTPTAHRPSGRCRWR